MDEKRAIKLLDETFNTNFDINRFSIFIKELFNKFEISPRTWPVWSEFSSHIDSYQVLGQKMGESQKN